jgi:hypothetical protein
MLLGIFPHEIEKAFFTLGLGPIFGPKNAVGKSLYIYNLWLDYIVWLFIYTPVSQSHSLHVLSAEAVNTFVVSPGVLLRKNYKQFDMH